MASTRKDQPSSPRRPPATSLEGRENQLVSLAVDLAERQMLDGTASSQVMTHYLKLGTTRERLEQEKLERENQLLQAKIEQLESQSRIEELYREALSAMSSYSGNEPLRDDDYND